jgi:PPOX class probable F420-dependent enzyme
MARVPDRLETHRHITLATYRRTGAEVRTPVWFAVLSGKLYVFTAGESGKVKRLRRSSRARVAPSDGRGRPTGPWHEATARIVTEPDLIRRAHEALRAKYGWLMRAADVLSRFSGRIKRRAWIEIDVQA